MVNPFTNEAAQIVSVLNTMDVSDNQEIVRACFALARIVQTNQVEITRLRARIEALEG